MKLSNLGITDVTVSKTESLYNGFLKLRRYTLTHRLFNGGRSTAIQREVLVRTPSVGVLLFHPQSKTVTLVEQFRIGPYINNDDPWLLEIVAGISEQGESLEAVAVREVKEEAGCDVLKLLPITTFYPSPGGANEKLHLYCGILAEPAQEGIFGLASEHEDIKVHTLPMTEAYQMVVDGRIGNAAAIIAIQWLQLNLETECQPLLHVGASTTR